MRHELNTNTLSAIGIANDKELAINGIEMMFIESHDLRSKA